MKERNGRKTTEKEPGSKKDNIGARKPHRGRKKEETPEGVDIQGKRQRTNGNQPGEAPKEDGKATAKRKHNQLKGDQDRRNRKEHRETGRQSPNKRRQQRTKWENGNANEPRHKGKEREPAKTKADRHNSPRKAAQK